jgi:hypothetical protein
MVQGPSTSGTFKFVLDDDEPDARSLLEAVGEDNYLTFKLLCISWTALLCDSPLELKTPKQIRRFIKDFCADPLGVIAHFDDLCHRLETYLTVDDIGQDISIPLYDEFCKTPVFREFARFNDERQPIHLRYLQSFLYFGKKVAYTNVDLDAVALRKWHQVEERLASLELPLWTDNLKFVLGYILRDWDHGPFLPSHGGGSVAERGVRGSEHKNSEFNVPSSIRYVYGSIVAL